MRNTAAVPAIARLTLAFDAFGSFRTNATTDQISLSSTPIAPKLCISIILMPFFGHAEELRGLAFVGDLLQVRCLQKTSARSRPARRGNSESRALRSPCARTHGFGTVEINMVQLGSGSLAATLK